MKSISGDIEFMQIIFVKRLVRWFFPLVEILDPHRWAQWSCDKLLFERVSFFRMALRWTRHQHDDAAQRWIYYGTRLIHAKRKCVCSVNKKKKINRCFHEDGYLKLVKCLGIGCVIITFTFSLLCVCMYVCLLL